MVKRLAGFPAVTPKAAGFSELRLQQFRTALKRETRELKSLPGAAHIILHRGRCVFACADGVANVKNQTRFGLDTLCALHGATKPLVIAAFLMLVDEGKVRLSDPISKYLKFPSVVRVASKRRGGKPAAKLVAAKPQATFRNLLTMTCCLDDTEAVEQVKKGKVTDLAGLCDALGDTALSGQPGSRYEYGLTVDMLGRVCEVVSGEPLDKFVEGRVLKPLGMKDTHFVVPATKSHRVAALYDSWQKKVKYRPGSALYNIARWKHPESAPGIMSAGGGVLSYNDAGMYGTARDYARFCQMLLDGGVAPGGKRLLRARMVKEFWRDGLAPYTKRDGRLPGWNDSPEPEWAESILNQQSSGFWDNNGWSLLNSHLHFTEAPRASGPPRTSHTMWMGGGGGAFWVVDTKRKLVAVSMTQCFGGRVAGEQDGADAAGAALDCISRPLGRDITPMALAAYDEGASAQKKARRTK